ncbi:MAG: M23 family metallopeptidase [Candidatus Gracilibacteria bacterium]
MTKRTLKKLFDLVTPCSGHLSEFMHPLEGWPEPKKLYTRLMLFSLAFLLITSVNITDATTGRGEGAGMSYTTLETTETYLSNDQGYLIKNMPLQGDPTFDQNRVEIVEHTVESGDTLSMIAYKYGLKTTTIQYANPTIGNGNYLKVGQTLKIPPKDGLYIKVASGDTLASVVKKYKGDSDKTKEFNSLADDSSLTKDEEIFIVGGQPVQTYIAQTPSYSGSQGSGYSAPPSVSQYNITPSAEGWIRPTIGVITQGSHGNHIAFDICDHSKPPILAAASGTVTEASSGTYGGGYGNHIQIDHGNGYVTLYAHMEEIYVTVGEYVSQGQVIGKMGNTGRVYGATGIHLHFELIYNGQKISPSNMGVW